MIDGDNQLTEEKRKLLKQGTKVEFKWHGSKSLYTGRIEVDKFGRLYFINEHCFENDKLRDVEEGMRYYNPLDSFFFFNHFEILGGSDCKDNATEDEKVCYIVSSGIYSTLVYLEKNKLLQFLESKIKDLLDQKMYSYVLNMIDTKITYRVIKARFPKNIKHKNKTNGKMTWIEIKVIPVA